MDAVPAKVRLAEGTGCKRIDVVADTGSEISVIEVKPYANYVALGQVLGYLDLLHHQVHPRPPARPMIVAANADPDILPSARPRRPTRNCGLTTGRPAARSALLA